MKKIGLISLLAFLVSMIIIGCGSNSKQDPLPPPPPPPSGSSYSFTNASTPLNIDESGKGYDLSVQLIDGEFGLPGQTVKMAAFDSKYGIVDPAEVETDDSGWAHFSYHSPDNVDDLINQSTTLQAVLTIYDDEDDNETVPVRSITQDFVLNFVAPQDEKYKLSDYSTSSVYVGIAVDANNTAKPVKTSYTINAYIVDEDNLGVEGEKVSITVLDGIFGYITPGTAVTDESGRVEFTYTVADDIVEMPIGSIAYVNLVYYDTKFPVEIRIVSAP